MYGLSRPLGAKKSAAVKPPLPKTGFSPPPLVVHFVRSFAPSGRKKKRSR
uniref:Uncharacterized protein n=1 Tax=Siphoviridae sp. ctKNZ79 TaxID=2825440 RepID=A0A8S5U9K1_9CAUD|nr:MAG TPA: hypothetical protein [Siphoviridae sp. ctKNZ79]